MSLKAYRQKVDAYRHEFCEILAFGFGCSAGTEVRTMAMRSNYQRRKHVMIVAAGVALHLALLTGSIHAQAPFYEGKTLTVINGNEPGGTGDRRMRAVLP